MRLRDVLDLLQRDDNDIVVGYEGDGACDEFSTRFIPFIKDTLLDAKVKNMCPCLSDNDPVLYVNLDCKRSDLKK